MKNPQENLATLNIWSRNLTTSTREPTTRAWISADIWRQDGAICSKNRKIVPYHGSARIPRLMVSVPDYGSWSVLMFGSWVLTRNLHILDHRSFFSLGQYINEFIQSISNETCWNSGVRLLLESHCIIVLKHVAFTTICAKLLPVYH